MQTSHLTHTDLVSPFSFPQPLPQRQLGRNGPVIAALGLGCMGMSEFYGSSDEAASLATLQAALDAGVSMLDTADMYGPYTNEELIGRAIRGQRDRVLIATKFGIVRDPSQPQLRGVNASPAYLRSSVEGSLRRLGTEVIDLYYLHRMDPNIPIEDTIGAMADLVAAGKIRYIGLSEASAETIRRAHAVHPLTALQSEYSLWTRDPEADVLNLCRELGIAFVAYSPLGRGFLSGAIRSPEQFDADDYRRHSPRFQGENFTKNLQLVTQVEQLAEQYGCTASQLALAWVLAQGEHIIPIPGTRRIANLHSNLGALRLSLSQQDLQRLNAVFPPDAVAGARYPAQVMAMVNR